jgi:hypothetical protein
MWMVWTFIAFLVVLLVVGVRASRKQQEDMERWAVSNGGFASKNSATKRIEFGVVDIFRDTGDETSSATTVFSIYPDKPCIPFRATAKDFRKGTAYGIVGEDPAIQSLMGQWKSGLLEVRAVNRKEQKTTSRRCSVTLRVNQFLPTHEFNAGIRIIERTLSLLTTQ